MVERWDIITIGNLSRNRYWGESDDRGVRPALCTSTLLRGPDLCLLVDPPLADADAMRAELDRRTGLALDRVTTLFITHEHGDHCAGWAAFPQAEILAAPAVAAALRARGIPARDAQTEIAPGLARIATPGHTPTHESLRFDCDGATVIVAGDAVMTRDFYRHRQGFFNSADFAAAAATIDRLAKTADILIPGHDNAFPTRPPA